MPYALSQIQLIPSGELSIGEVSAIRNKIIDGVVALACKELSMTPDKMVVRDIRALLDLDYTYEDWRETTGAATGWETMSTGTMGDNRWIALYGVKDDGNNLSCTSLKFNVGGADRVIWHLQHLNEEDGRVGICPGGLVIPQRVPYTISRYVRSVNATSNLVLKGVVVEKRGLVLSP